MSWDTTWADLFPDTPPAVLVPFYGPRPVVPRVPKTGNARPEPSPEAKAARKERNERVATKQSARAGAKRSAAAQSLAAQAKTKIAKAASSRVPEPPAPSTPLKAHVSAPAIQPSAAAGRPRRTRGALDASRVRES